MATPKPILTPWPWDLGVDVALAVGMIRGLDDEVNGLAAGDIVGALVSRERVDFDDVEVDVFVVFIEEVELPDKPTVVKGTPRSKVVTVGSGKQG